MDNFARVVSIAPIGEYTHQHYLQLELCKIRAENNEHQYFTLDLPHPDLNDLFPAGRMFKVKFFPNINIVWAYGVNEVVSMSAIAFIQYFAFVTSIKEDQYAFLTNPHIDEILQAADRWFALQNTPGFLAPHEAGYGEDIAFRSLSLVLSTDPTPMEAALTPKYGPDAQSKLTELVDIVRATAIEERLAAADPVLPGTDHA